VEKMKKLLTVTILVALLPIGFSQPASASSEVRLKTEAMTVWVAKSYPAPQGGCIDIPIRYKWAKTYRVDTIASVSIYTPDDQLIGDVYWRSDLTPRRGTVFLRICDSPWVSGDGYDFVAGVRGRYQLDFNVTDLDNPRGKNIFQDKSMKIRLR